MRGPYPWIEENVEGRPVPICHGFEFGKYLGEIEITFKKEGSQLVIKNQTQFSGNPVLLGELIGNQSVLNDFR